MADCQPPSACVAGVGWAMPAALITAWAPAGQLSPLTRMFPVSTLLCGATVGSWVGPPLYQLPENVLSSVLLVELALVKAHTPASCTTLFSSVTYREPSSRYSATVWLLSYM